MEIELLTINFEYLNGEAEPFTVTDVIHGRFLVHKHFCQELYSHTRRHLTRNLHLVSSYRKLMDQLKGTAVLSLRTVEIGTKVTVPKVNQLSFFSSFLLMRLDNCTYRPVLSGRKLIQCFRALVPINLYIYWSLY